MSPEQFKYIRESFGLTQNELATCLGLHQKTISQYEIGFRKPGPTVVIVMNLLQQVSHSQSQKLLDLMEQISEKVKNGN
ncbi:MAG: helix-turn-helix transcriptional regulator [Bdellovibrionales bacterium]|nr:helix-turn-helix transcriptional regulator [Bdellovibrionales bacterium]